ncbi:CYTH and CHAD domain-containing protein [Actinomadura flavalba]|uniref:CYTH and CHAD domain-containing protein n=1 Tax=Actinomadura flavalba TaxID=1120938 RepID=UPI00037E5491|nr:CYTH and CHAD domain-containing protein [Actinomadura flavalba]
MADRHLEIEDKYDAAPDFTLPDLSGLPGVTDVEVLPARSLRAVYFDTADLRLAAHGITLRRRRGGADAGWHLKIPAEGGRTETRVPLGRSKTVPGRLARLVSAWTRGGRLLPVAALDTERTATLLHGADGPLAEVADDLVTGRVLLGTGTGVDLADGAPTAEPSDTWREIEVELSGGDRALLKAAAKKVRRAGAVPGTSPSKLARVLNDRVPVPEAARARAQARATTGTAGDAVLAYLATQVDAIYFWDTRARQAGDDAVHKMRVATRRLRSAFQSYAPLLDAERTGPLKDELKWLAGALGEVRDLEVLRMRFTDRLETLDEPVPSLVSSTLPREEKTAYRALNRTLTSARYHALLDALDALHTDPPLRGKGAGRAAAGELPRHVGKAWRRMEKREASIAAATDRDEARHATRKAAKRARYAADVAVPVLGKPAKKTSKRAKRLQTVLGDHQDAIVAMERLRATRPRHAAEGFTLGLLYGLERAESDRAVADFTEHWQAIGPPDL